MLVYTFLYGVALCDCMIFDTVMHKDLVRSLSVTFCQALSRVKDILCPIWRFLFDNHLTRALLTNAWHPTLDIQRQRWYIIYITGGYMKRLIACIASFLLPGLGQMFYCSWGWALFFFVGSCLMGPLGGVLAAAHIVITKWGYMNWETEQKIYDWLGAVMWTAMLVMLFAI